LLETLTPERIGGRLYRLANMRRRLEALSVLGMASSDLDEVLRFLDGDGDANELLDAPSRFDPSFRPAPTGFSDGSWRVFYGTLDWETAEAEVGYHVLKAAEGSAHALFYQRMECTLDGVGYDFRPQASVWPFLTNTVEVEAYPACQALAREARASGADGLLTRSARRPEGANAPVFNRAALSDPKIVGSAAILPDASGWRVERR